MSSDAVAYRSRARTTLPSVPARIRPTAVATACSQSGAGRLPSCQRTSAGGMSGQAGRSESAGSPIVVSQARPERRPSTALGTTRTEPSQVGSKVKLPKATGPEPGRATGFAQPLLAGREPVLAGRQRDPGSLTPADQPFAMTDPGQCGGFGEPAHQAAGVGYGDGADGQPFRCRLALVTAAGFHACQLYVAATAAQVPGSARACRALPRPAGDHIPGRGRHRRARVAGSDSY